MVGDHPMLYTVVPLERVYANMREREYPKNKIENADSVEYKEVQLKHGRIVTRRDGESYVVEKINSTDMSDYLNDQYSPGKPYSIS